MPHAWLSDALAGCAATHHHHHHQYHQHTNCLSFFFFLTVFHKGNGCKPVTTVPQPPRAISFPLGLKIKLDVIASPISAPVATSFAL